VMPGAPRFYIPQLDGLRFLAFLAVFVGHAVPAASYLGASFGVNVFFVLSSYLITSLLVREADAAGRIDVPAFWIRRALRIWPLYFGFLFANAILWGMPARVLVAFSLFAGNWVVPFWEHGPGPISHLWSVSVEEQFYLAWPLVLAVLPRRLLRPACFLLMAVAVVGRYALYLAGFDVGAVWLNSLAQLDAIGVGALVALTPRLSLSPMWRGVLGVGASLAVVALARVLWHWLLVQAPGDQLIYVAAPAATSFAFLGVDVACGCLLIAVLAGSAWLAMPPFVYLGRISYGLYVFHQAVIRLVGDLWWPWRLPMAFVLTVVVAAVSYRYLELPFLRLKSRFELIASGAQLSSRTFVATPFRPSDPAL